MIFLFCVLGVQINLPLGLGGLSLSPALTCRLGRGGSPVTALSLPAGGTDSGSGRESSTRSTSTRSLGVPVVTGEARLDGTGADLLSTRDLGLVGNLLVLLRLGVTVEVQVDNNVPVNLTRSKSATETEDLTGQHPPDQTDGVTTLVVGGDGNVNEVGGGVSVAESNDGDVDVAGLLDGLGIGARVGHDDQTGLLERAGDVVGEVTGGETTGNGGGTGVRGELEDSTLTVGTSRDHTDVGRVFNGGDDTGSQENLLPTSSRHISVSRSFSLSQTNAIFCHAISHIPGLANVQDVNTVGAKLPEVRLHVNLEVLGSQVALSRQEHLNVLGRGVENRGELRRGHDGGWRLIGCRRTAGVELVSIVWRLPAGGDSREKLRYFRDAAGKFACGL